MQMTAYLEYVRDASKRFDSICEVAQARGIGVES
jgi:hypothetical protein